MKGIDDESPTGIHAITDAVLYETYHKRLQIGTVCVQLRKYAENVALPASAATCRAVAPCCYGTDRAAIDRYLLPAGPTAANPPHAAAAGTWTDGWTQDCCTDPAQHTIPAVPTKQAQTFRFFAL